MTKTKKIPKPKKPTQAQRIEQLKTEITALQNEIQRLYAIKSNNEQKLNKMGDSIAWYRDTIRQMIAAMKRS